MGGVDDGYRCIRFAAPPADPIFSNEMLFPEWPGLVESRRSAFRRRLTKTAVRSGTTVSYLGTFKPCDLASRASFRIASR